MNASVSELTSRLQESDLEKRIAAAEQLAQLGLDAAPAVVPLLAAIGSSSELLQEWATACLENCGAPELTDLPAIAHCLQTDAHPDVKYWAVTLLGRLEDSGQEACDAICQMIEHQLNAQVDDDFVIQRGVWALGRIGQHTDRVASTLTEVQSTRPELKIHVQRALDRMSSPDC